MTVADGGRLSGSRQWCLYNPLRVRRLMMMMMISHLSFDDSITVVWRSIVYIEINPKYWNYCWRSRLLQSTLRTRMVVRRCKFPSARVMLNVWRCYSNTTVTSTHRLFLTAWCLASAMFRSLAKRCTIWLWVCMFCDSVGFVAEWTP